MKTLRSNRLAVSLIVSTLLTAVSPFAALAASAPSMGTAENFAVLGGSFIVDSNPATGMITGDVGLSPAAGSFITGLTSGQVSGTIYATDATGPDGGAGNNPSLVGSAKSALTAAYGNAAGQTPATTVTASTIDSFAGTGYTLAPGIYKSSSTMGITGTLTLSGSATDVWIFQAVSSLTTASGANIVLTGGAQACNVFWQVGSSATLGTNSLFKGTILADQSITDNGGSVVQGRLLASIGSVTLNNTTVVRPTCAAAPASSGGGSAPTPPEPPTLTVIKHVINDNGGTAVASDASVSVKIYGKDVAGSPAYGQESGRIYQLVETGTTTVSEVPMAGYTSSFSGDCNSMGEIYMDYGYNKTCTITNNDISLVPPLINITKIPTPLSLPGGAGSVTYDYLVTNLGLVGMSNVKVNDDKCSNMSYVSGDLNGNSRLGVNETWSYRCTTNVATTTTNTVTATGDANGFTAIDLASATVVVGAPLTPPLIHVVKWPSTFTLPIGGGDVTYYYFVTNPGTEPLSNVSITDNKCTGLPGRVVGHPGDLNQNNLLDSNETWNFTCQTKLTQTTTNIGTATGFANGFSAVDISPATVVVGTPKLPNTGFPPDKNLALWYGVLIAGLLTAISSSFVSYLKKSAAK